MTTKRIQPDRLFQRALKGHTLYSHVVIASGKTLVFIAGQVRSARANLSPRPRRSLLFQPIINLPTHSSNCFIPRSAKLDFGGFRIFRIRDRQGPFIAARARTNEIFDFLVVHGVEIISSACLLGRPITSP